MSGPVVLPGDVQLIPVRELDEETRRRIGCEDDDVALTRPRARTPSRVVDAGAAALLEHFRTPTTIVQAVIKHSRQRGLDPEQTLEDAYPLLMGLVTAGLLVDPESEQASSIAATAEPGDAIAGCEVLATVQVLDDTELYQVRLPDGRIGALKVARATASGTLAGSFDREAAVLRLLGGRVAPALWEVGDVDGRPYLLVEWCAGVDALAAADDVRRVAGEAAEAASGLAALGVAILDAYAALHADDVLQSDIHPRNVLVDGRGGVRLIDFGFARVDRPGGPLEAAPRAGVGFFFEPEFARAALEHAAPPLSSRAGEQYGLGALVYQVLTGAGYRDFSLDQAELMRQVTEDPPLPFADRDVPAWPEVEAVLARALSKDPAHRYPSVAAFADALRAASDERRLSPPEERRLSPPEERRLSLSKPGDLDDGVSTGSTDGGPGSNDLGVVDAWLARLETDGNLWRSGLTGGPTCSVNFGAAGVAVALHRIAAARGSARALALADLWGVRALRDSGSEGAFLDPALELDADTVGPVTPYHTAGGVHAARALVARALDDPLTQAEGVAAFCAASDVETDHLDLTLGASGTVVAAALLRDALGPAPASPERGAGREHGVRTELLTALDATARAALSRIWGRLDALGPIGDGGGPWANLGIAHGWGGYAYAALLWSDVSGDPLPPGVPGRLAELAALAEPWGRGVRWPWELPEPGRPPQYMPGWCNGSAGYVILWTLAHRVLGDEDHLRLAELAAWNAWEDPQPVANLCCGLVGRSYGLLTLWRHTGDAPWLARARRLAREAASGSWDPSLPAHALYKGELGLAVLAADLAAPARAAMPFFEQERWPRRAG